MTTGNFYVENLHEILSLELGNVLTVLTVCTLYVEEPTGTGTVVLLKGKIFPMYHIFMPHYYIRGYSHIPSKWPFWAMKITKSSVLFQNHNVGANWFTTKMQKAALAGRQVYSTEKRKEAIYPFHHNARHHEHLDLYRSFITARKVEDNVFTGMCLTSGVGNK